MFDISFGELFLICVVALVVLGPERLPTVARTLGALVARAQRFVSSVKADIGQQADLASLNALKNEVRDTAYALKTQLVSEIEQAQTVVQDARAEVEAIVAEPAPVPVPPPAPAPAGDDARVSLAGLLVTPGTVETREPSPAEAADAAPVGAATALSAPAGPPAAAVAPVVDENQLDLFADLSSADSSRETTR